MGLPTGRALLGGLLMAVAALGAYWLASSGGDDGRVDIVVADRDLRAGDVLSDDDLRLVPVAIDGEVRGLFGSLDAAVGRVVMSPVDSGEFLVASATSADAAPSDTFELTVSVGPERVPGDLRPAETIDVFATWNSGLTELIAVGAVVVDVTTSEETFGGGDVRVRMQVADIGQAEAVVHAHSSGELTLVRAPTGSDASVGRQYRPGVATDEETDS